MILTFWRLSCCTPPPIPPIAKNQSDPMGVKAPVSCLQFKYCCPLRFSKPRAEDWHQDYPSIIGTAWDTSNSKLRYPHMLKSQKMGRTSHFIYFFYHFRGIFPFFLFLIMKQKTLKFFFQLDFSWFQCTRYPGVPKLTTPRGKSPLKFFFWSKFLFHQILWTKTRRLTPRLSI